MKDERITGREAASASFGNEHLYRDALAALRRGDRLTAERLLTVMLERGVPIWQEREVADALFPLVPHSRGFLTSREQQRALRRSEQRRRP